MSLLRLTDVTRSVELPDESTLVILSGVTLAVEPGDHVSIVGRSGSGKTTLLNLIGLIDTPTTGTVHYGEVDANQLSSARRDRLRGAEIGFVFQQFNLLAGRTALENVMTPLLYATGRQFWKRRTLAAEMLDRVGLAHRLQSMPDRLSGGEQQRVAIARALIRQPKLILADEPTGALDIETGASVMALLDEITRTSGSALVTITHDPKVAALASRHYRLDSGVLGPVAASVLHAADGVLQ